MEEEDIPQCSVKFSKEDTVTSPLATENPNVPPQVTVTSFEDMAVTSFEVMYELACKHANGEIQRIHGLELPKTSTSEAYISMHIVFLQLGLIGKVDRLDQSFVEMACTSLFIFWNDYELVNNTLCNIKTIAQIASDEAMVELIEKRVILAASLSVCFQGLKGRQDYVILLDKNIELVMLIYHHILECGPYPVDFHHLLLTSFMMVVPFAVDFVKRNEPLMAVFVWNLKELLIALHKICGRSHITMTKNWLKKHGIVDLSFAYLRDKQLGISYPQDLTLIQLLCITMFLINDVKQKTLRSIIPKLLEFLDYGKITSLKVSMINIEISKPYRVAALFLEKILMKPDNKVTEYLSKFDFIGTIQRAVDRYPEIHQYVPGLLVNFININKFKKTVDSSQANCRMVNDLCRLAKPFLIGSNNHRSAYAKMLCTTFLRFHDDEVIMGSISTDGLFDLTIKAYTVLCFSKEGKDDEKDIQSAVKKRIISFLSCHFEKNKTSLALLHIVESLPETLANYSRKELTNADPHYRHLITLLVTKSFDDFSNCASERWNCIHYLMVLHYAERVVEISFEHLVLLWKFICFDMIDKIFIPTLKLAQVELKKCETVDTIVIKAIEDLIDTGSTERYYKLLIMQIRSLIILERNYEVNIISVQRLRSITQLLCAISMKNNMKYQQDMLKGLVFACLDVVRDVKDLEIEDNVNMFVIHLFLNLDDQESKLSKK